VASLSQGRTAAAQCGLFTYKSVPVIFEPPCMWKDSLPRLHEEMNKLDVIRLPQEIFFSLAQWARVSSFTRFLYHTRLITVGRNPLDEWSARRRDLYLTTHNTHNRNISMPPVGFETTFSAGEWPQTYVLDSAATGTGSSDYIHKNIPNLTTIW